MKSDVLIIGGGVIGLSIARELRKKGVSEITIVDRGTLGAEASWAAAGMLAPNIETDCNDDFHRFGKDALEIYPGFADSLREETGIDIELDRSGTLCVAFDESESSELAETFERQKSRDVAVDLISGDSVRGLEPRLAADVRSALFYANDWQVENRKLLAALQKFAELNAIRTIGKTEISTLSKSAGRVTGATTSSGEITADVTVIATGAWTSLIKIGDTAFPVSVKPIRGQMISFETESHWLQHVVYSRRGYLVPRADGRILVGATVEDTGFDKGTTGEASDELSRAAVKIIPGLGDLEISEHWAGLRPFAADGLPIIGAVPGYENLLVATAHYRNGILLAPKTAEMIADRILDGVESEYFEAFGIERFGTAMASAI